MSISLTQQFNIGSYACYYDESPPENEVGIVVALTNQEITILAGNGEETTYSKEQCEKLVESYPPDPENTSSGLPIDPEVWDTHHTLMFREREYKTLQAKDSSTRLELAQLLQCPASWSFLLPKIRELAHNAKKAP